MDLHLKCHVASWPLVRPCITHDLLSMNLNAPFKHHGLKDSELALLRKGIEVMFS
jgi:hypothetical protein